MKKIAGILLMISLAVLGGCKTKNPEDSSTHGKDYSQYANPNALVSPQKAKELIESGENVVVIDTRNAAKFTMGHIEGAQNMWRPAMGADEGEYEFGGMRANPTKMAKELGKLGVDKDTYILMYDDKADYDAARLWWILKTYGHDKMSLIDGGVAGWKGAGYSMEMGKAKTPKEATYTFDSSKLDETHLAKLEDVKKIVDGEENGVIIDTRSVEEHEGSTTKKGAFRPGRIPSNTFIPWESAVNYESDKTFKSVEDLKKLYSSNGVEANTDVIAYCQSGVRSAHTTFVLTQLLGYDKVRNYDGSWIEWSYHEELQADTGKLKK